MPPAAIFSSVKATMSRNFLSCVRRWYRRRNSRATGRGNFGAEAGRLAEAGAGGEPLSSGEEVDVLLAPSQPAELAVDRIFAEEGQARENFDTPEDEELVLGEDASLQYDLLTGAFKGFFE